MADSEILKMINLIVSIMFITKCVITFMAALHAANDKVKKNLYQPTVAPSGQDCCRWTFCFTFTSLSRRNK